MKEKFYVLRKRVGKEIFCVYWEEFEYYYLFMRKDLRDFLNQFIQFFSDIVGFFGSLRFLVKRFVLKIRVKYRKQVYFNVECDSLYWDGNIFNIRFGFLFENR